MSDPDSVIITSVAVMAASSIVRHQVEKKGVADGWVKPVAYGFFLAIALLLLAMPFPTFARNLALLGLVGAFVVNGPAVFKLIGAK